MSERYDIDLHENARFLIRTNPMAKAVYEYAQYQFTTLNVPRDGQEANALALKVISLIAQDMAPAGTVTDE